MGCYIVKYMKGCNLCNQTKTFMAAPAGKLMPNCIAYHRWQIISVDLIMELPQSHGYDSILAAADRLSKWAHFIPTTSNITSLGVAQLFRDSVWKLHGLPEEVISDRGPQFVSNFMRGLSETLGIKVTASTAYHPQTDGQTECVYQEVEQFLHLFVNQRQDDWYDWISIAKFAYNDRVHASTQASPFMLNAGQNPQLGFEPIRESQLESLDNFMSRMAQATDEARATLVKAADDMAQFYNIHWHEAPRYSIGDKVWLSSENIRMTHPMKKLNYKWLGPYTIDRVISCNAYRLKLPVSFGQVHPIFSVTLLCPYDDDPITERHPLPPPPVICDSGEEYEVEKILDSQIFCRKVKYLVRWKGYGVEEDEWRPSRDI